MLKIGFVGAGNMAGAIINGLLGGGKFNRTDIAICDKIAAQTEKYRDAGHPVFENAGELAASCEKIVLSVKPQNFAEILPEIAEGITPEKLIISIAAGISAATIKKAIGFDCKVVTVMPNTPMLIGMGASALSRQEPVTEAEFGEAMEIFRPAGIAAEIPADKMCEIIPVNGSSPAFVYEFAKHIVESAERHGLDGDTAMALFCETVMGSAKMLMESGKRPQELIDMVGSKGGTTIAAMEAMRESGFGKAISDGFDACVRRAKELSGE